MRPKEKAYELYEKFFSITPEDLTNDECVCFAKQCALIAVNETIEVLTNITGHLLINKVDEYELVKDFDFLEEVKQEIEKL